MRIITLFSLIFFVLNGSVIAQWNWLNPKPSGYINTNLTFVNADTGYLFNSKAELFKTYNGGSSWQFHQRYQNAVAMDIHDSTGVIAGWFGTLYISTNNGITWEQKSTGFGDNFKKVDIISRDTIVLINPDNGAIYKSNDRGNTWQTSGTPNIGITSVDFIYSNLGYMAKWDGIFKTTNGGTSWQNVYQVTTSARVLYLKFYDANYGFAYREFNQMLKTTDGGATWTSSNVPDDINDIFFVNQNNAYAVGEHGVVYRTTDAGNTWTWASPSGRIYAYDLLSQYFFNDTTGYVVGHRGRILKTSNGGTSWQQHATTYIDFTSISFGTNTTSYATTWNNIYKSTDKGQTWNQLGLEVGTTYANYSRFEHSKFFSADTGIVTASLPARIYKTYDGGQNWTISYPPSGSYEYISGLSFLNNTTAFASFRTSNAYGLYKTSDAGSTWQEIGSYQNFLKLHFINEQTGYASQYQKVFRTSNGANSWTEVLAMQGGQVESMYFIDAAKGFVAGEQGFLKMTLDSGKTWISVSPPNYYDDFVTIKFFGDKVGYLTAEGGKIFKTIDGGLTWRQDGESAYYECPSITFTSDTNVYIAGMYGSILTSYLPEYRIDSLKVDSLTSCSAVFSSKISAVLSQVDSIWFQYGINDFTTTLQATPFNVNNDIKTVKANALNLTPGASYKVRVKIYYRGVHYYSNTVLFNTSSIPKPVITVNANTLTSSALSGNQWFLNGQPIAGAVGQQYTATVSGSYTVQVTLNGCLSQLSDTVNVTITAIIDPQLDREIILFPNPSKGFLYIKNGATRNLEIRVNDVAGKKILQITSGNELIDISTKKIMAGFYFVIIKDKASNSMTIKRFIKL